MVCPRAPASGEEWVPSVCYMCFNCCGIKVRRLDGVAVGIKGDQDNPHNLGRLCAKGNAGIMSLYDPYRVRSPLMRTNPEKGVGVDPRWVELSWDLALETVAERLKKIRQEDPRRLLISAMDFHAIVPAAAFASAFGTPNYAWTAASYFCGNVLHPMAFLSSGAFYVEPDLERCNYLILIGSQLGFMTDTNATMMAKRMADARARGMKVVVVDPVCNPAAAKADEWIPIRPGTDGALALGMINHLVNDLGEYDRDFLRMKTNAPYLIRADGKYERDLGSGVPLVWDMDSGAPVPFDMSGSKDAALAGDYDVGGILCRTAFGILKEHVKAYQLEEVSRITTVPAKTIRRITEEFARAAMIGSRIAIEGAELPYRPVAVQFSRGAASHKHGMLAGFAIELLNVLMGAIDVPGGSLGVNPVGPGWETGVSADGLLVPSARFASVARPPYPGGDPAPPETLELSELFPVAPWSRTMVPLTIIDPEKFGLNYTPEVLIHARSNLMMSTADPSITAEALKRIPFIISFARELDETVEFADLVLPDCHYLERLDPFPNTPVEWILAGEGCWYWEVRQPAVEPPEGPRHWVEVLFEVADRAGFRDQFNMVLNVFMNLQGPHRLEPEVRYNWQEVADRWVSSAFGKGLSSFRERGFLISRKKTVREAYPGSFSAARIPIYLEHLIEIGERLKGILNGLGLTWDISDYQPVPDWRPCPAHSEGSGGFDLIAVNYKLPFHTFSYTAQNPWLCELAEHNPRAYKILLNEETARAKGIKDGEMIKVKSIVGEVMGEAKLTQGIHPEVVGIAGTLGHWAQGLPVAKGKGVHFNSLLPATVDRIDMVSAALDSCIRVTVTRASGAST